MDINYEKTVGEKIRRHRIKRVILHKNNYQLNYRFWVVI